jgi:hypothetical protein
MKMKKMILLMLVFFLGITAGLNAQVNIGSNNPPKKGTVLDLSQSGQKLGLALPTVTLTGSASFQLDGGSNGSGAAGTIVYHDNANADAALPAGLYVWTGSTWIASNTPPQKKLTAFTLSPTSLAFNVSDADITVNVDTWAPFDASVKEVTWSISGNGTADIASRTPTSCTIKAGSTVENNILTATATDGSGTYKTLNIRTASAGTLFGGAWTRSQSGPYGSTFNEGDWTLAGDIEIAPSNALGGQMDGGTTLDAVCSNGWRLPNIRELKFIYDHLEIIAKRPGITQMTLNRYWSSTQGRDDLYGDFYRWSVNMNNGALSELITANGANSSLVRCVRDVTN